MGCWRLVSGTPRTSCLPPALCSPGSQGLMGPVRESCSVAWHILPSAQSKAPGRPLPNRRLAEDSRLPPCLGSQPMPLWSLGSVRFKLTQLKRNKEGSHRQVRRLLGRGWRGQLTCCGTTPSLHPYLTLGTCKQPFCGFYLSPREISSTGHNSQGHTEPLPSPITLSSNSEVPWRESEPSETDSCLCFSLGATWCMYNLPSFFC